MSDLLFLKLSLSSRHGGMINNGFNSTNNDHRNNSFDRSMSTSSFENNGFGHNNRTSNGVGGGGMPNGYDRQMSAPNLRDQHQMNGGYGSRGGHGNPNHSRGGGNDYSRGGMYGGGGRPSSPPNDIFSGNGGGDSNFMKIGTWNDPSGGGSGGGMLHNCQCFITCYFNLKVALDHSIVLHVHAS